MQLIFQIRVAASSELNDLPEDSAHEPDNVPPFINHSRINRTNEQENIDYRIRCRCRGFTGGNCQRW